MFCENVNLLEGDLETRYEFMGRTPERNRGTCKKCGFRTRQVQFPLVVPHGERLEEKRDMRVSWVRYGDIGQEGTRISHRQVPVNGTLNELLDEITECTPKGTYFR